MYVRTDERMKIEKPVLGRPLLGPAIIGPCYWGTYFLVALITFSIDFIDIMSLLIALNTTA